MFWEESLFLGQKKNEKLDHDRRSLHAEAGERNLDGMRRRPRKSLQANWAVYHSIEQSLGFLVRSLGGKTSCFFGSVKAQVCTALVVRRVSYVVWHSRWTVGCGVFFEGYTSRRHALRARCFGVFRQAGRRSRTSAGPSRKQEDKWHPGLAFPLPANQTQTCACFQAPSDDRKPV